MAMIQKRTSSSGKISYRALIRLKGHPTESATFERKTDASDWAADRESDIRNGRHFPKREARKHTAAKMIDRYAEQLKISNKNRYDDILPMLTWWKDEIGYCVLSDLNEAVISEKIDELSRRKIKHKIENEPERLISPARVNRYIQALSHVCTVATKEWKWLPHHPMQNISRKKEPRGRVRFLDDDERMRLLKACRETESKAPLYLIVILAISTGARKGEIMNLTWDTVDFDRKVIVLNKTKNDERRVLPLTGHALDLLRAYYKKQRNGKVMQIDAKGTDLLFPSLHDKKVPFDIRTAWETAREKAQITNFHFHDLRHCTASYLAMDGANLSTLAEVLGHKSLDMVKRYAHLSETHTRTAVASMNKKIFGR